MVGYMLTGSPEIARAPAIMMTMAITHAKIGLFIKNLDSICFACFLTLKPFHCRPWLHQLRLR